MMKRRKTTRRDFLTGKSAARAIGDLVPDAEETSSPASARGLQPPGPSPAAYLFQVGRTAMACEFDVYLNAGQHAHASEAALEALDLVDALEDQMTFYRDHSEISRLNRLAAHEPVAVEGRLFALLQQACDLHRSTLGAFDITSTPLTKLWRFHRRLGRIPPPREIKETLERVGTQWLRLEAENQTVQFDRADLEINLNAIGKGHALDRCRELLRERGVDDFLIHGGQSSILACGQRMDGTNQTLGWQIALRHPLKADERLGTIWLRDRALGTSGSGQQFFHYQGRRFGHVIDPRTGMSVEGILSATVLAPTAAMADALATAFFVMGVEKSLEYCEQNEDLATLLVCPGKREGSLLVHARGLDADQWQQTSG
jgi:thiamine biosynthesis lipoprotein